MLLASGHSLMTFEENTNPNVDHSWGIIHEFLIVLSEHHIALEEESQEPRRAVNENKISTIKVVLNTVLHSWVFPRHAKEM